MLKENLVMLRNIHGYSQEKIAEKIGISRQAYAKWETGATVPDIEKCSLLAEVYHVSLDDLINSSAGRINEPSLFVPKGKNIWGTITVNERGQIVIPKGAREQFFLHGGSKLVVLTDEEGIALLPIEKFEKEMRRIRELAAMEERGELTWMNG